MLLFILNPKFLVSRTLASSRGKQQCNSCVFALPTPQNTSVSILTSATEQYSKENASIIVFLGHNHRQKISVVAYERLHAATACLSLSHQNERATKVISNTPLVGYLPGKPASQVPLKDHNQPQVGSVYLLKFDLFKLQSVKNIFVTGIKRGELILYGCRVHQLMIHLMYEHLTCPV